MAEELRIVLTDQGGSGSSGTSQPVGSNLEKARAKQELDAKKEEEKARKEAIKEEEEAKKEAAAAKRLALERIESVGSGLSKIARGDNAGAVNMVVGQLGVLGKAFVVAEGVIDAFNERGKELAKYSGTLAAANSQANFRGVMDDIKEANELGPGLAGLRDATSEAQHELREILLPIKKIVVEYLSDFMTTIADFLKAWREEIAGSLVAFTSLLKALVQAVTLNGTDAIETLKGIPDKIRGVFKDMEPKDEDVIDILLRDLRNIGRQAPQFNPANAAPNNAAQRLNIPAFQGR